jgi:hypothetical protein
MAELNFKSAFDLTALIRKREAKPSEAVAHACAIQIVAERQRDDLVPQGGVCLRTGAAMEPKVA